MRVNLDNHRVDGSLDTASVLVSVLQDLGIPASDISDDPRRLPRQYQNASLEYHFLLVLENLRHSDDVSILQPVSPVNLVLVTTAAADCRLRSEVTLDRVVELPMLDDAPSRKVLESRCAPSVLDAEPDATDELLGLCGGRPRILVQAGVALQYARAAGPGTVVRDFLETLPAEGLAGADDVIAEAVRRAFDSLGAHNHALIAALAAYPAAGITPDSAQAAAGFPVTRSDLAKLVTGFVLAKGPDERPVMDEVTRRYVPALLPADCQPPAAAVSQRLLRWLMEKAREADSDPGRLRVPEQSTVRGDAVRAKAELGMLLDLVTEVVRDACGAGQDSEVCLLVMNLELFANRRSLHSWFQVLNGYRITSARRIGDPFVLIRAYSMHARMHFLQYRFEKAQAQLDLAWAQVDEVEKRGLGDEALRRRVRSSVLEMQARLLEMRADDGDHRLYSGALECMRQAIEIDRELGEVSIRDLSIHLRMGANIHWKAGEAGLPAEMDEARRWVDKSVSISVDDVNRGRAEMVRAKVCGASREFTRALCAHDEARRLLGKEDAGPYERELCEIDARLTALRGLFDDAIEKWAKLMDRAVSSGSHDLERYSREISRLRGKTVPGRFRRFFKRGSQDDC